MNWAIEYLKPPRTIHLVQRDEQVARHKEEMVLLVRRKTCIRLALPLDKKASKLGFWGVVYISPDKPIMSSTTTSMPGPRPSEADWSSQTISTKTSCGDLDHDRGLGQLPSFSTMPGIPRCSDGPSR